ncbi:MAG: hypothetical protein GX567_10750 [Clostridia bacterium]|nr:hypothetical protein [Clostridia bacterium]
MKLHDITQELFRGPVYPGDPVPKKEPMKSTGSGDGYNLTLLSMGSHNGTHMDAPFHFLEDGNTVEKVALEQCIGTCKVVWHNGNVSGVDMEQFLKDGTKKLLIKGKADLSIEAATVAAKYKLELIGVEEISVAVLAVTTAVHKALLSAKTVIVEGLELKDVSEGHYFLSCLPLKMEGLDGSPVRAVLLEKESCIPGYQDEKIKRIRFKDVYYFEAVDNRVFLYCQDEVYETKNKLYEVETLYDSYFRASKSVVLNIDQIDSIKPSLSGRFRATLLNGEEVEISRQYVPVLKNKLGV